MSSVLIYYLNSLRSDLHEVVRSMFFIVIFIKIASDLHTIDDTTDPTTDRY